MTDILTPILSLALGRVDFENLYVLLAGQSALEVARAKTEGAELACGAFLNTAIEFVIVAFSIFPVGRPINQWRVPAVTAGAARRVPRRLEEKSGASPRGGATATAAEPAARTSASTRSARGDAG